MIFNAEFFKIEGCLLTPEDSSCHNFSDFNRSIDARALIAGLKCHKVRLNIFFWKC